MTTSNNHRRTSNTCKQGATASDIRTSPDFIAWASVNGYDLNNSTQSDLALLAYAQLD